MRTTLIVCTALMLTACGTSGSTETGESTERGEPAAASPTEPGATPEAAPSAPAAATPVQVAEAYLRAGSAQSDGDIRANLDPACHENEAMTRVDSVRVMGVPITIAELSVDEQGREGDRVTVRYTVSGRAQGSGGTMEIFGARVQTGEVNIENANQSGTLTVASIGGRYLVTCAR